MCICSILYFICRVMYVQVDALCFVFEICSSFALELVMDVMQM